MKIFDAFTFYNEIEILKLRLTELHDVVEKFCIVEGDKTFTGKEKPSYFPQVDLPQGQSDKILRIIANLDSNEAWKNEVTQRNAINLFFDSFNLDGIVIISDVDEIPNMDVVLNLDLSELPVRLDVKQYFWNAHWEVPKHCNNGARPIVAKVKDLIRYSPQELRANGNLKTVPNGGWHFSFFGTEKYIVNKIESFSHTEYDRKKYKDLKAIKWRIENGIDPFDRFPLKYVEIDETYPKTMQEISRE